MIKSSQIKSNKIKSRIKNNQIYPRKYDNLFLFKSYDRENWNFIFLSLINNT